MNLEIIIAATLIIGLLFLFAYKAIGDVPQEKKKLKPEDLLPKRKKVANRFNVISQKMYARFTRLPLLGPYTHKIRLRLEAINSYDEYTLRRETMRIVFTIIATTVFVFTVLLLFNRSYLVIFWAFLAMMVLNGVLIDFFVHRLEDRLLRQMQEFTSSLRHRFQQLKMVDEAVYEAAQVAPYEMKLQAESIYEVLTATDLREELTEYEETAPNRFLRAIAAISVMVMEQGDKKTQRGSAYLNGLAGIAREINFEVKRRTQLSWVLKGLSFLTVFPVFFAIPIKNWATTYFPVMLDFYNSRMGLFIEISLYVSIVLSYVLIRKLRDIQEGKYTGGSSNTPLLKRIYEKRYIKPFVDVFTPKYYQKAHYKQRQLLKDANSPLKVEWLTLQRLLLSLVVFMISLVFIVYSNYLTTNNVMYSPTGMNFFGKMSELEQQKALETTEFDRNVIHKLKEVNITDRLAIIDYVGLQMGISTSSSESIVVGNRIYEKVLILNNTYLKWWEFLLSGALAIVAYYVPILILAFQRFFRKIEMEEEIHQYNTIISVLSEFDRITVYELLEWMERFSVIFKEPLKKCLLNYDSGAEQALNQLKEDVSFPQFSRSVDRLLLSVNRISIREAFEDLDIEKDFHVQQRDHYNNRMIEEKQWWGNIIGITPFFLLVMLYLIIPMVWVSIQQVNQTITTLT